MQGENPLECAKRELREETGILIDDFIEVGRVLHQKHQTIMSIISVTQMSIRIVSFGITLTKMVES